MKMSQPTSNVDSIGAYLSTFNKPVIKKAPKVKHSVPHVHYMHALENP